jgi:hypothetical protein
MKDKVRYTDEPMKVGRTLPHSFFPSPDKLVFTEDAIKVTLSLSARSVNFFKTEAARHGVQYQRMIRRLLDAYVDAFTPESSESRPREATKAHRVEQRRGVYRGARKQKRA